MPQGLQIFNEQGVQVLDVTDSLTRYGGRITLNTASGQTILPAITDRIWIYPTILKGYLNHKAWDSDLGKGTIVKVKTSLNGKVLSWKYLKGDKYINALPIGKAVVHWGEY